MAVLFSPWLWTALASAFGIGWIKGSEGEPETAGERTGGRVIWVFGLVAVVSVWAYFKGSKA